MLANYKMNESDRQGYSIYDCKVVLSAKGCYYGKTYLRYVFFNACLSFLIPFSSFKLHNALCVSNVKEKITKQVTYVQKLFYLFRTSVIFVLLFFNSIKLCKYSLTMFIACPVGPNISNYNQGSLSQYAKNQSAACWLRK